MDYTKRHHPCGHWHKTKPRVSSDTIIGIAPMYFDGEDVDNSGIGLAFYNATTGVWSYGGVSFGGAVAVGTPNTLRINRNFSAYYGVWYRYPEDDYTLRLHIFQDRVATTYDLFVGDTNNTFQYSVYNVMDAHEDGLVVCLAYIKKEAGVTKNAWVAKSTVNGGLSWSDTHYFPSIGSPVTYTPVAQVRIDDSGVSWVFLKDAPNKKFYIYKASYLATNWEIIHTEDLGGLIPDTCEYSVSPDGQYQYAIIAMTSGDKYLYVSTNSGVSWSSAQLPDNYYDVRHAAITLGIVDCYYPSTGTQLFKVSSDYGSTFVDSVPSNTIRAYAVDIQSDDNCVVYSECGEDFDPGSEPVGFLYSINGGSTWSPEHIPSSPVELTQKVFTDGWQQNVDIIYG